MNFELNKDSNKFICPECKKEYTKNGIKTHYWRMHTEEGSNFNPNKGYIDGSRQIWNKGLTKETNESLKKASESLSESLKNYNYRKGKTLSEEHKNNLSKSMKKYFDENPDKVPYLLNHYSNGESYPEKYFREIFESLNVSFKQEYRVGRYSLDFLINDYIDIEIDGEQHYVDNRIVNSDINRTKILESKGYLVKRVRWSTFKQLSFDEKCIFVKELLS